MSAHKISKSQYLKGLQCPKSLWLYRHRNDLAPEITPDKQTLFDTGSAIGDLAKQYFSGGVEVTNEYWDVEGAVEATKSYINRGENIIFEATTLHPIDGGYSRIDILKRVEGSDEWDLIEVKGSTSVKDYHYDDMAFQYHVFHAAGYKIRSCQMMLLDNTYIRIGEIDPKAIFKFEDITPHVLAKQAETEAVSGQLGYVLERKEEPKVSIGAKCFAPFECDYRPYCWAHVPDYSVYDVFQKPKAEEIAKLYGLSLEKLPRDIWPSGNKALDLESYLNGQELVDTENIQAFLSELQYPLYFLDYETLMPEIPLFDGTRPFQQIPFQYSVHIQQAPSSALEHKEFLHQDQSDPRKAFVEKLVQDCGTQGTIIVYNQAFEIARNNELAADFPEYAESIRSINDRVIDLLVPFRNRWLYHPNQKGSASIKAVLPAFTDLSYDDLEIAHGGEAMRQYGAFMSGTLDASFWDALWQDLSAYCEQDTYAMYELLKILKLKAQSSESYFSE